MDFRNLLGKLNQLNESVEVVAEEADSKSTRTSDQVADALNAKGVKYSPEKEKELIKMIGDELKNMGMNEKQIRYLMSYDEDFIGDTLSGVDREAGEGIEEGAFDGKSREELLKMKAEAEAWFKKNPGGIGSHADGTADFMKDTEQMQMQQHLKDIEDALEKVGEGYANESPEDFDRNSFRESFETMVEAKKKSKKKMPMDDNGTPNDKSDDKPAFLKGKKDTSKKDATDKDAKPAKGLSAKQKKLPPGLQKAIASKKGKTESVVTAKKKAVAESIGAMQEEKPLTFKDLLGIVKESGGQQKIDCVDTTLWSWAQRVANAKYEGAKAEVFAGMLYERNGGRFEMHDILSEDK